MSLSGNVSVLTAAGLLLIPVSVDSTMMRSDPSEWRMGNFNTAIKLVLEHEGGYVNDPDDPGGETNYGISKRSYPDVDIANLTQPQAVEIYQRDFWDKQWNLILSQDLSTALLDASVNMGRAAAVKLLQRAANKAYCRDMLTVDGVVGAKTIAALNEASEDVLREFRASRSMFYIDLAWNQPTMKKFLPGWIRRAVV